MSADKSDQQLPEELKSIEAALRELAPAASSLDRDRLMYLAGQASVRTCGIETGTPWRGDRNWWAMATAAALALSVTLGAMLWSAQRNAKQIVYVQQPNAAGHAALVAMQPVYFAGAREVPGYLELRNVVLAGGLEALPAAPTKERQEEPERSQIWPLLRNVFPEG